MLETNRFEKMDFLRETLSRDFFGRAHERSIVLEEMVRWMTEDEFNKFFETFCSHWDIASDQKALEARLPC